MKHLRTEVEGRRKRRVYDEPKTPFERLRKSGGADVQQILRLEKQRANLNPFELKRRIEKKLRAVLQLSPKRTRKVEA